MSTFPFVLVRERDGERKVVRHLRASSKAAAVAMLPTFYVLSSSLYVESEASFRLGRPNPIPPHRCIRCGRRDHAQGSEFCEACSDIVSELARENRQRKETPYPERHTVARGPYKRRRE